MRLTTFLFFRKLLSLLIKFYLSPSNYLHIMKAILPLSILLISLASCQNTKEESLENLDKKSAREVTLSTVTTNDTVYHITKQNIWVNGSKIKEQTDTIKTALKEASWGADSTAMKLNEIPIYVTVQ
jgi:hypothetical protein